MCWLFTGSETRVGLTRVGHTGLTGASLNPTEKQIISPSALPPAPPCKQRPVRLVASHASQSPVWNHSIHPIQPTHLPFRPPSQRPIASGPSRTIFHGPDRSHVSRKSVSCVSASNVMVNVVNLADLPHRCFAIRRRPMRSCWVTCIG